MTSRTKSDRAHATAKRVCTIAGLLGACGAAASSAHGAVVNSQWINTTPLPTDTWGVAANWSPAVVPDNGVDTYNVFIDLPGSYAVVLDQNRTITNLELTGTGARLELFDGTSNLLTVLGNYTQGEGTDLFGDFAGASAQSSMVVNGDTLIEGGDIRRLNLFQADGGLHLSAASKPIGIGDASLVHNGTTGQWSGGSDLRIDSGGSLTLGAASVFTINATGNITQSAGGNGAASITNNGQLIKASAGTVAIADSDIALNNVLGATVNVQNGTLATDGQFTNSGTLRVSNAAATFDVTGAGQFTNFTGNTLSGGTLDLTGTLKFNGADVVNLASNVTLDGTGGKIVDQSDQDALRNTSDIDSGGKLLLRNGAAFTIGASVTQLDVNSGGEFDVGVGSKLTVPAGKTFRANTGSTFANIAATTTGGEIVVNGTVQTGTASITTIGSKLTLDGDAAAITNLSNVNAIGGISTVSSTGALSIVNRSSFAVPFETNAAVFNVQTGGHITVGSNVSFDIPTGTLGNLASATLDLGRFTLQGRIRANLPAPGSIPALTLNNTTTLDGVGSSIFDINSGFDLFSRLSVIDTGGDLSLLNGRALALTQPLTVRGRLFIGNTAAPRPGRGEDGTIRGAGTQEILQIEGDVTQERGFTAFDTGRLRIVGSANAFKVLAGGIGGTGTIEGNTWLGAPPVTGDTAFIAPGDEGPCNFGTIDITGNLRLRQASGLKFDLGTDMGSTVADELDVLGVTTIDPGVVPFIEFHLCDSFVPTLGQIIPIANLNMASAIFFSFSGLSHPNGITITPMWSSGDLSVIVTSIPGPAPAALGLTALLASLRRRRD
ncbi:MAG: beta strand repeat-containing protein [Phycisphaerales bacterium]